LTVLAPFLSTGKTALSNLAAGALMTYTIRVSNTGNTAATSVVVTDALPLGASYAGCGGGTCVESGSVITWSGLTVPDGNTHDVTFAITGCSGTLVNSTYRVAGSAEGISSPWGAPVTTTVLSPNLAVAFTPASAVIVPNTTVVFTDTSTTDGGPIIAWKWDLGEATGSGRVVSHTYTALGAYTVTLTVTDTCGYSSSVQVPNAVQVVPPCVPVDGAGFIFTPLAPKVGETVIFTGSVAVTSTPPITYTWNWGDGSAGGAGNPITHVFPLTVTAQTYSVTLTASNACPSQQVTEQTATVWPNYIYLPIVLRGS
jgi:uncharacterized repeat protein (TIGR01451 family)